VASGTTFKEISARGFSALEMPIPTLSEQQQIVEKIEELFSELDAGRQQLEIVRNQLETYQQSVLHYAFSGRLGRTGRDLSLSDDLPASPSTSHREYNPTRLPKGWKWVKLNEIVRKSTVKVHPKDFPNLKFIGMDCIEPNTLGPFFTYDFSEFKSSGNYFNKGQILYGRMRPYLNKVYKAEYDGACSGEFIILQCIEDYAPDLLKYILHSDSFVAFATSKTSGDRPRVTLEEIGDYAVIMPPRIEQDNLILEIESRLSICDKLEEAIETCLQQSEALKQSILKQAFEGKLVKSPNNCQ
jgi:type I restriction enzyme S subunit